MLAPVRQLARVTLPAVVGYLLGSIPTADLVSGSVDLRDVGDRNPGYWNARQALGSRTALPVLVGDVGKGLAATAIGRAVARPGQWWPAVVGAGAAMVGHAWPLFARFRGGRAVATFIGAAAVLSPALDRRRGAHRWRDVRRPPLPRPGGARRFRRLPAGPAGVRRTTAHGCHGRC